MHREFSAGTGYLICRMYASRRRTHPYHRDCVASPLCGFSAGPDDAPKSDVAGRRVDRLHMARGRAVAAAIIRRAEMRAALDHLSRNFDLGLGGVIARVLGRGARVLRDATRLRGVGGVNLREPIRCPLPDIADHVAQAVAVGPQTRSPARSAPVAGSLPRSPSADKFSRRIRRRFRVTVGKMSLPPHSVTAALSVGELASSARRGRAAATEAWTPQDSKTRMPPVARKSAFSGCGERYPAP
jgi:hypothetical protein